jgi:hypothetical protein
MREIRTSGSVGAPGGEPPGATRRAPGKPGSIGKEKSRYALKVEIAAQRVKVPSGQRLASRPVASLAWCGSNSGCEA